MLPKMRYRLGLDLGANSIGWCLVRLDSNEKPIAVIRMGTRIFPDGRNPKDGSSLAVTRRLARQMRRRRDRLLKRKARMLSALTRLGFFPQDPKERKKLELLDPYALRKKGLYQPLTGPEFARALFHINQRRGFLSNRKTDRHDSESGLLKQAIHDLRAKLEEERCQTLGEWLANRHEKGLSVRARLRGRTQKDKAYDFYADRAMIEHEFDTLWASQQVLNPTLYTEAARAELKDILLFQRPLRPVKPGRCTLLPDEERAPLALPSVQRFRIYQELNNLRLLTPDLRETPLSLDQRDTLANLLERGDATFKKIRRTLGLPATTEFNLEDIKREKLIGNRTTATLSKDQYFGDKWHSFDSARQDEIVHLLLNEASEAIVIAWLQQHTGIDEATAERIAAARLSEGYGNISRAAIAQILPELVRDVIVYSEAVHRAGLGSHSALSHAQRTGEILDALPYYGEVLQRHVGFGSGDPKDPPEKRFGRIANPTVHIGLNQLRRVVNAIIRRYGHPSQVIIEVARELKLGRERKLELQRQQKERQDRNDRYLAEACRVLGLSPANLDKAKRRELTQKMQLWYELNPADVSNRRCPYTGEQISIQRLLSNEVEIEHILPYSRTLDDSLNNKTVSLRAANRDKGNRTPYEAFGQAPIPGYDYQAILERATLMPAQKKKRFAPDGYERWLRDDKDFLARALNDTAYLSRIAKEYLSLVCPPNKVRAIPGRMTALLRGKFGLNELLSGNPTKNRDDHRHHAIDAAVVAVTDQGLLKRFSDASARAREKHLDRLVEEMPLPWPSYREHVRRALNSIVVSHKPDHGYQGAMHEETAWGFADDGSATRSVRPEDGGPRVRETKKRKLVEIRSTTDLERHGTDEDGRTRPYKGYVGGSNYCLEIWRDDAGKWKGDVISTFDAYQTIREHGEKAGSVKLRDPHLTQSGQPLVMRLMINDLIRLRLDDCTRIMRVAVISGNGQVFMCDHNEANVDARNRERSDPFSYVSKYAGSLQRTDARRVLVTEIGDIRPI
jgi:CRISPR-associated endonuclease Csn1